MSYALAACTAHRRRAGAAASRTTACRTGRCWEAGRRTSGLRGRQACQLAGCLLGGMASRSKRLFVQHALSAVRAVDDSELASLTAAGTLQPRVLMSKRARSAARSSELRRRPSPRALSRSLPNTLACRACARCCQASAGAGRCGPTDAPPTSACACACKRGRGTRTYRHARVISRCVHCVG
jgi:hypothetical protein